MTEPARIIVTRPEPDGRAFAAMAEKYGARAILSPAMDINPVGEAPDLTRVGSLAFTSANGVRAIAGLSANRSLPVFAVGGATAAAARAAGFSSVIEAGGDEASLADLIKAHAAPGGVLHIAGRDRAGDLVAALKSRCIEAARSVLYEAAPRRNLSYAAKAAISDRSRPLWAALFSPRSTDIFMSQVRAAHLDKDLVHVKAACLSQAVAARIADQGLGAINVAEARTSQAMLALITGRDHMTA